MFRGDRSLIAKWRIADEKTRKKEFSPVAVGKALDDRYGHTKKRREEHYRLFSELAGHPNIKSTWMMRPRADGDAVIGPFIEETGLMPVLSEMGRLAVQAGQHLDEFFPVDWDESHDLRQDFALIAKEWIDVFYGDTNRT